MSRNYIRDCAVTFAAIGKTYDAKGIRVRFKIKQSTMHQANVATILLSNQNPSLAKALVQTGENTDVTISAGYVDNIGVIFKGKIRRAIYGRENPTDTLTTILASDGGHGQSYATVNTTLPPGKTPKDIYDVAHAALKKYGVDPGFVGKLVDLSKPVYPRSIALFGMAWKLMNDIAKSKGATASIQNMKTHLVTPQDAIPGGAFELNTLTGLIGMPTLEIGGLYARTLINPQMKFHSLVHIDEALIQGMLPQLISSGEIAPGTDKGAINVASIAGDGVYRIYRIDVDADTRGEPWYQDLAMNNHNQAPTQAETEASAQLGGTP